MPRCEELNSLLLDFAYELLDEEQVMQVREHLDGCDTCQSAYQEALGQKALLARAARVYSEIPTFSPPSEVIDCPEPIEAQSSVVARSPTVPPGSTEGLPDHLETCGPPQRHGQSPCHNNKAPRRLRPRAFAWVACAAAVLLCVVPYVYFRHGLATRQGHLAELRREVADTEARLTRAEVDFRKGTDRLAAAEAIKQLHLQVTGSSIYYPEVESRYRVEVDDLEGNALSGKVEVRLVDAANKLLFQSEELPVRGERVVSLPAGLSVPQGSKTRLEVRASAGELSTEIREEVIIAPADPLTQLTLNKRNYQVGEIVFFRSVTLDRYSLRPIERKLHIQHSLRDAEGKTVLARSDVTGAGGIASGEFALTRNLAEGDYTLLAADEAGRTLAQRTLRIVRDVPAELYFNRQRYRPGDKVVASYQAPRAGKDVAVANQAVTVNFLRNDGKPAEGMRQPMQVFTDQMGQANIEFQLPRISPTGPERLEIRLGEDKLVRDIPLSGSQPHLEFFPEGGDLLADVTNTVYFRATTSPGEPADVEGRLLDSGGHEVALVRTEPHDAVRGLGVFTVTPRRGETYRLQITSPASASISPALRPARNSGVALHVENPVDFEGEPVRVTVRSVTLKQLLLVASCRERTVAQQYLSMPAGSMSTALAMASGAQGTLRVTAYEVRAGGVTPLAERLVFREPARRLALSASTDKFEFRPGESVRMKVYSADENGAAVPGWLAALVVDERVLPDEPSNEQSMPAFFYLLSDVGQARDLDNADVLMAPGDQARRALDLFLGTHGWRHFVPAKAPGEVPGWFYRDNRDDLLATRAKAIARARADLAALQAQSARLRDHVEGLRDQARVTFQDLVSYEEQPRQLLGIGLGVLVTALLLVGGGLLLWGIAVLLRGGVARPHFLVAMALLGCSLMTLLAFGNRAADTGEPVSLAWIQDRPHPVLTVRPKRELAPPHTVQRPSSSLATRSRETEVNDSADLHELREEKSTHSAEQKAGFKDLVKQSAKAAERGQTYFRQNVQNSQTYSAEPMSEALLSRFNEAKLQQQSRPTGTANPPTKESSGTMPELLKSSPPMPTTVTGAGGGVVPPVVPVSPAPPSDMKASGGSPEPSQQDDEYKRREYAHQNNRKGDDAQDTVFWHPALVTQSGEVRVLFDLSSVPTSYRVLLYGHTSDGRLGGFQGRLTTRSPNQTQAGRR
jgi:hypothetical protein